MRFAALFSIRSSRRLAALLFAGFASAVSAAVVFVACGAEDAAAVFVCGAEAATVFVCGAEDVVAGSVLLAVPPPHALRENTIAAKVTVFFHGYLHCLLQKMKSCQRYGIFR